MKYHPRLVAAFLVLLGVCSSASLVGAAGGSKPLAAHPTKEGIDLFEKKIRPVLVEKCYQCHSAAKGAVKGKFALDTRDGMRKGGESGVALVPGDPDSSLLIEALRYEGLQMPPKEKLPDEVIENFVQWIALGAPDPRTARASSKKMNAEAAAKFWAYQPPKRSPPPAVKDASWPKSNFDSYVLAALEAKGLKPVADADKLTLLRRVTFDLIGLPPTPEEIAVFLNDPTPEAFEGAVDRLLASPQFGERWGRHWLDVARYGESTGKERNYPFTQAWRYRDWVIDAVNADLPYNEFITQQVAGDLLPAGTPAARNSHLIATGFLALGPKSLNERNHEIYLMDQVDDQIDTISRAVLATTVGCARCHDHKFDPIPTSDYYALAGIFRSTDVLSGVSAAKGKNYTSQLMPLVDEKAKGAPLPKATVQPRAPVQPKAVVSTDVRRGPDSAQIERRLEAAQKELKELKAGGRKTNKARIEQLEQLVKKAKKLKEGKESKSEEQPAPTGPVAMAVSDRPQPADCQICIRGEVGDRGPSVPRGFVTVLNRAPAMKVNPQQSGRLELAKWLASRTNPLTARVEANRIWYHLFGQGIVETLDNFGALGEEPSHPELLDVLALYLVDHHWSVKQTIRAIVLSRAYQLSSVHDDANYAVDPSNRFLWRSNRRRLDAESIRDAILAASGQIDLKRPEGSPIEDLEGKGEIGRRTSVDAKIAETVPWRSVYLPMARNAVPEMLGIFNVADPSLIVGQREVTTVATQALFLMNNPFILKQSELLAERLLTSGPSNVDGRIDLAYRLTLSRMPTAAEAKRAVEFLRDFAKQSAADSSDQEKSLERKAMTSFCQVLFASAEFRYLY